jgi:hypothetical protein
MQQVVDNSEEFDIRDCGRCAMTHYRAKNPEICPFDPVFDPDWVARHFLITPALANNLFALCSGADYGDPEQAGNAAYHLERIKAAFDKANPCEAALSIVAAQLGNIIYALEAEQHEYVWELVHELRSAVRSMQMGG